MSGNFSTPVHDHLKHFYTKTPQTYEDVFGFYQEVSNIMKQQLPRDWLRNIFPVLLQIRSDCAADGVAALRELVRLSEQGKAPAATIDHDALDMSDPSGYNGPRENYRRATCYQVIASLYIKRICLENGKHTEYEVSSDDEYTAAAYQLSLMSDEYQRG